MQTSEETKKEVYAMKFYANPYNPDAAGFYFTDQDDFAKLCENRRDRYGALVEEFEIDLIDAQEKVDIDLFEAIKPHQGNIQDFCDYVVNCHTEEDKHKLIIAFGHAGEKIPEKLNEINPNDYDIDVYYVENLKELAEQFLDEGLFGEIPDSLQYYIDIDAIARDLQMSDGYSEDCIGGTDLVWASR